MFNYIIQVTKKKQVSKFYAPDYATAVGMARITLITNTLW